MDSLNLSAVSMQSIVYCFLHTVFIWTNSNLYKQTGVSIVVREQNTMGACHRYITAVGEQWQEKLGARGQEQRSSLEGHGGAGECGNRGRARRVGLAVASKRGGNEEQEGRKARPGDGGVKHRV